MSMCFRQDRGCPLSPPVILGSAIPPVPPSLVEKIETGKFIEMGDLVPSH